jgi:pyruvate dehydrogenase E2 component (dihydrolipoamide acetyltransferase)
MSINITMPALSPTMEEGTLAKWHVKEGDSVAAGDVIAEIETDKATMEVEAVDEGTIGKILIDEGTENVKVNVTIAVLLEEGEDASAIGSAPAPKVAPKPEETKAEAPKAAPVAPSAAPAPTPVAAPAARAAGERVFASPLARRMAKDAGIDVSALAGSGPKGRVIKVDVERAQRDGVPQKSAAATVQPAASTGMSGDAVRGLYEEGSYEEVPNDGMRKVVAARLSDAKRDIPHFYITADLQIDALMQARADINGAAPKNKEGKPAYKLSINDFVMKAWAQALQQVPLANATWAGDSILYHKHSDVAVAVAVPGGLFTPVVKQAEMKSLRQISDEVRDLATRAKSKKLAPHEYQGGTSSVSNLGMFGVKHFTSIINPPHGTIISIGAGEERIYPENGEVKIGTFMTVSLSCDHRSVDGALGAELLGVFKGLIEQPLMMLA